MPPTTLNINWTSEALADLFTLDDINPSLSEAALQAVDDLSHHRKTGKALAERERTGDLSGFYRLKFDLPDTQPERYRVIYRLIEQGSILEVWAVGQRLQRAVYLNLMHRLEGPSSMSAEALDNNPDPSQTSRQ